MWGEEEEEGEEERMWMWGKRPRIQLETRDEARGVGWGILVLGLFHFSFYPQIPGCPPSPHILVFLGGLWEDLARGLARHPPLLLFCTYANSITVSFHM
jgi:hypothetical protein